MLESSPGGAAHATALVDLPEAVWAHIASSLPPRYLRALRATSKGLRDQLDQATISAVGEEYPQSFGGFVTTPPAAATGSQHGCKSTQPPAPGTLAASPAVYPAGGMGQLLIALPFKFPTRRAETVLFPRVRRLRLGSSPAEEEQEVAELRDGFLRFVQRYLPSFASLTELDLFDAGFISDAGLAAAAASCKGLVGITSLSLERVTVSADPHSPLDCLPSNFDNLRRLHIDCWSITEEEILCMARLPFLAEIIIDFYVKPSKSHNGSEWEDASTSEAGSSNDGCCSSEDSEAAGLAGDGAAPAEAHLVAPADGEDLNGAAGNGAPAIAQILQPAESLIASMARTTIPLEALSLITGLRSLSLVGYHGRCAGVAALSNQLEALELDGGSHDGLLDNADLAAIRNLTRLTSLQLHNYLPNNFSPAHEIEESIGHVLTLATTGLRELALTIPITADCVVLLSQLSHLTSLEASFLHIHDDAWMEEESGDEEAGIQPHAPPMLAGAVAGLLQAVAGAQQADPQQQPQQPHPPPPPAHRPANDHGRQSEQGGARPWFAALFGTQQPASASAAVSSSNLAASSSFAAAACSNATHLPAPPPVNGAQASSPAGRPPPVTHAAATYAAASEGPAHVEEADDASSSELTLPHLQRLILDELGDVVIPLRQLAPQLRELHVHAVTRKDDIRHLFSDVPPTLTDVAIWLKDEVLDLRHTAVNRLRHVVRLSLEVPEKCVITAAHARIFAPLTHLEDLTLRCGDLRRAAAKAMAATLRQLRRLRLVKMDGLKGAALEPLAKLPRLEALCLDVCALSRADGLVSVITAAPMLRDVVLRGCDSLPPGEVKRLRAAVCLRGQPLLSLCIEELSEEELDDLQLGLNSMDGSVD